MSLATRITDNTSGICDVGEKCCPHGRSGQNSTGSDTVFIDDLAAHRLSDSGSCQCPHGGQFISEEGSEFQGCGMTGQHVSGSETVDISR